MCPDNAYVGQRDCTEVIDLHQDANGLEVLGGDYVVAEYAATMSLGIWLAFAFFQDSGGYRCAQDWPR